jgi:hypothetical protein
MKKASIKKHLKAYSFFGKRNSTINHAFASALAPFDKYDEHKVNEALEFLGQEPDRDLQCVYCNKDATGWDHLVGLVKDKKLRGFGHQIGNLVPCCGVCNSKKGSKRFDEFITYYSEMTKNKDELIAVLIEYQNKFAKEINLKYLEEKNPSDFAQYVQTKEKIFNLMKEADDLADKLRDDILH